MNTINSKNDVNIDQDKIENVMAIVLSFMENAIQDAATYVEHSGRKIITKKDIRMALQAETFEYMKREDMEGSLLYYKETVGKDIDNYNDSSYEDSDSEEGEVQTFLNSKVVNDKDIEDYSESLCRCPVCKRLNHAVNIWDSWEPQTDMEKIIKKVIDTKLEL